MDILTFKRTCLLIAMAMAGCGSHSNHESDDVADAADPDGGITDGSVDAMPIDLHDAALQFAEDQLHAMTMHIPTNKHPSATGSGGAWKLVSSPDWRSGFYTGSMWLMFDHTADAFWSTKGEAQLVDLEKEKTDAVHNDTGFKVLSSFGQAFRLTGNDDYRKVVVTAASTFLESWDDDVGTVNTFYMDSYHGYSFGTIIDYLMNLELLTWASNHGGDPSFKDKAISHARKTLANHVRPDGSTYQVVMYDPNNGHVLWRGTRQGAGDDTTWSRGQAWAIYGFTMMYRETQLPEFLDGARKTADYWIANLPADSVPNWDFSHPGEQRDSSAAAIAASGLLELAHLETDSTRALAYHTSALATLDSLSGPNYLAQGTSSQAILLHAVTSKPSNSEVDVGLSYGDYYYIEALLRLRQWM